MTSGRECSSAVTHALKAGYRAVDSAEWYANEREVGSSINAFLKSNSQLKREDIWFTTKLKSNVGYEDTRRKIKQSIKESGLGYIDLYLLHSPYGGKSRRLECWRAVEDAVTEGEVRVGGVSNFGVRHVCICHLLLLLESWILTGIETVAARTPRQQTEDNPGGESNRSPPLQHTNRYNILLRPARNSSRSIRTVSSLSSGEPPSNKGAGEEVWV